MNCIQNTYERDWKAPGKHNWYILRGSYLLSSHNIHNVYICPSKSVQMSPLYALSGQYFCTIIFLFTLPMALRSMLSTTLRTVGIL